MSIDLAPTPTNVALINGLTEAITPGDSAKVVRALRKNRDKHLPAFRTDLEKAFKDLGDHISDIATAEGGLILETSAKESRSRELWLPEVEGFVSVQEANLNDRARKRIDDIIRKAKLDRWVKDVLAPIVGKGWRLVGEGTEKTLQSFDIEASGSSAFLKLMIRQGGKRAGLIDIDKDTKKALFDLINEGMKRGWGSDKVAREIREYVPQGRFVNAGAKYRAEMIARTEIVQANGRSAIDRYQKSKVVRETVAFDGDGDIHCMARNGRHFSFSRALQELANTHPNCVLTFGPVV